jgi:hypothetical protein
MTDAALSSPHDRRRVARDPQRSRITNGKLLPGIVDERSAWVRRCKDVIASHLSDIPDATAAERSLIRRISVLTTELERLEAKFAVAEQASERELDLYIRGTGSLRRLLESVGLERRARDVGPTLHDYLLSANAEANGAGAD